MRHTRAGAGAEFKTDPHAPYGFGSRGASRGRPREFKAGEIRRGRLGRDAGARSGFAGGVGGELVSDSAIRLLCEEFAGTEGGDWTGTVEMVGGRVGGWRVTAEGRR